MASQSSPPTDYQVLQAKLRVQQINDELRQKREARANSAATPVPQAVKRNRKLKNLEYPLNNPDDYKARIVFSVVQDEPTDLDGLLGATGKKITETISQVTESDEEKQVKLDAHAGRLNETVKGKGNTANIGRSVALYLPVGLQYRDNVAYENVDIGGAGAAAQKGIQSGSGIVNSIIEGGSQTFAAGLFGSANKELAKLGTIKLASKILPDEIKGALKVAAGVTTNPNTRVLFKQVNMREFSFAFKMIATSEKEVEEINEIVRFFRTELYPDDITIPIGNSEISVGYRFPNKFQIDVEYDGEQLTDAPKIEKCYLRDVGVTFNATNMSMHAGGHFSEVDITLAFQESRTLSRKDIEFGGY